MCTLQLQIATVDMQHINPVAATRSPSSGRSDTRSALTNALFFVDSCTEEQLLGIRRRSMSNGAAAEGKDDKSSVGGQGQGAGGAAITSNAPVDELGANTAAPVNADNVLPAPDDLVSPTPLRVVPSEDITGGAGMFGSTNLGIAGGLATSHGSGDDSGDNSSKGGGGGEILQGDDSNTTADMYMFCDVQSEPNRSPPVIGITGEHDNFNPLCEHRASASTGDMAILAMGPAVTTPATAREQFSDDEARPSSSEQKNGDCDGDGRALKTHTVRKHHRILSDPSTLGTVGKGKHPVIAQLYANISASKGHNHGNDVDRETRSPTSTDGGSSVHLSNTDTYFQFATADRDIISPADSMDAHGYFLEDTVVESVRPLDVGPAVSTPSYPDTTSTTSFLNEVGPGMSPSMKKAISLDQILATYPLEDDDEQDVGLELTLTAEGTRKSVSLSPLSRDHMCMSGLAHTRGSAVSASHSSLVPPVSVTSPSRSPVKRGTRGATSVRKSSHKSAGGSRGLSETVWSILRQQVSVSARCLMLVYNYIMFDVYDMYVSLTVCHAQVFLGMTASSVPVRPMVSPFHTTHTTLYNHNTMHTSNVTSCYADARAGGGFD